VKLTSFEALAAALEAAGVRYLVAGGLAVGAHGYLRFTKDVDIVVQLVPENIVDSLCVVSDADSDERGSGSTTRSSRHRTTAR
jgi:hypothetical protein